MSCTVAAEKALSNSSRLPIWVMATSVLVTEVPILAPISIGTAILSLRPAPPMAATMIEVKVDELCTNTVPRTPIIRPTTGLFCNHGALNISPVNGIKNKSKLEKIQTVTAICVKYENDIVQKKNRNQ